MNYQLEGGTLISDKPKRCLIIQLGLQSVAAKQMGKSSSQVCGPSIILLPSKMGFCLVIFPSPWGNSHQPIKIPLRSIKNPIKIH